MTNRKELIDELMFLAIEEKEAMERFIKELKNDDYETEELKEILEKW